MNFNFLLIQVSTVMLGLVTFVYFTPIMYQRAKTSCLKPFHSVEFRGPIPLHKAKRLILLKNIRPTNHGERSHDANLTIHFVKAFF